MQKTLYKTGESQYTGGEFLHNAVPQMGFSVMGTK